MAENQGLKVVIVVCAWPPQGGGIGNNAYYHAKELSRRSYRVTVFTPKYRNQVAISADGFTLEYSPVFLPLGKAGFLFSLFSKLKDFDIIHLYYPFFGTDFIIYFFKKFHKNKKLVLHYEMDPIGTGISKIIFKIHLKLFLNPLLKISDKIIVLSWDNAEHGYLKKYLVKNKINSSSFPTASTLIFFSPKPRIRD
jgi:glycosyltransferase involved in cell wall biosynthesis